MLRIDDGALYQESLARLERFTGRAYLGRLAQIFLACKHYGNLIPRIGAAEGATPATIQRLLDALYDKPSLRPGRSILSLFSNSYLNSTGSPGADLTGGSNNWRNNFNAQKGFSCFASVEELSDPIFRDQSRKRCPHLQVHTPGRLEKASCGLDAGHAKYRNEDHAKVFRLDPITREVSVHDPADTAYFEPLIRSQGHRLPIAPLVIALYYDSIAAAGRSAVELADFLVDFDFTAQEALVYFDDDPALPDHAALIAIYPGLSWTRLTATPPVAASPAPLPSIPVPAPRRGRRASAATATVAPPTAPPAGGHWWDAEQAVRVALENDGWFVRDMTRLGVGYDHLASKAGTTRFVEVKSSAGRCSPDLTSNELREARAKRQDYVLAVVENFDPVKPATILWVQDPASLVMSAREITVYTVPRSSWYPRSVGTIPSDP